MRKYCFGGNYTSVGPWWFFCRANHRHTFGALGEHGDGLYADLPYFLFDSGPQGFLGRLVAEEMASLSGGFPADPRRWNTDHVGRYLVSNGDDLPGNLKFGWQVFSRLRRKPVAETRLMEMDGRLFLESQRFDRACEFGRLSMISLQAVDAEFVGLGSDWPRVMGALHKKNLERRQHVDDADFLWSFGRLINNTDMHLGNLSLAVEGDVFRLLPLFDMCSMGFAPKGGGEVAPYGFVPPEFKEFLSRGNPVDLM